MKKKTSDTILLEQCEFSVIPFPFTDVTQVLTYFERLRAYVQHEDGLINSRLTWSLTIHGFLFAIFGVLAGKITDVFTEGQKNTDLHVPLIHVMSALFFLQLLIAAFGALVGWRSYKAIKAAHFALKHLWRIAEASEVLTLTPMKMSTAQKYEPGAQVLPPHPQFDLKKGSHLLVEVESEVNHERVCIDEVDAAGVHVTFTKQHPAGASLQLPNSALLPRIVSGGAPEDVTSGAHAYYLALPFWAMVIWLILLTLALTLCAASLLWPGCFFSGLVRY